MITLSELCELIVDCEHKTAPTVSSGFPLIRTPNVGHGRLDIEGAQRVDDETYRTWTKRTVPRAGDLILAREAPVGNVGPILPGIQPVLGQRTVLIRSRPEVLDPMYLNYLLSGPQLRDWMAGVSSGATVPHLNMADIRAMQLPPLPPIQIQRKIGAILSAYDELIENNNRRIKTLEEIAQRIYREWFVDFRYPGHEDIPLVESELGPIPEAWTWRDLQYLAAETRVGVDPASVDPETPYIGLEHMPKHSIAISQWGAASEAASQKYEYERGQILFGRIRPYFHKVVVPPVDGLCSTDAIVISSRADEYWGLILVVVSSDAFVAEAVQTSQGTKMPRANWSVLKSFPVAVPEGSLLRTFNTYVKQTVGLIHGLVMASRNLRATRDLLLPHLVSGEIDVAELDIAMPELAT